jgi:16S rRNA (cytosine967-C5)-methyltransferase
MQPNDAPIPLWQQLQATARVLGQVRQGQSGTAAIDAVPGRLRAGVQALSFAVLRRLGWAQALRQKLAPRLPPPQVDALLCTALALLSPEAGLTYDAHTLVNQAVEAAKRSKTIKAQSGFINAILRRYVREQATWMAQLEGDELATWNHPTWWVKRLRADWPEQWQQLLQVAQSPAPMVLRVNVRKTSRDAYGELLEQAGIAAQAVGLHGLRLSKPCPVQQLPHFSEGWVSVQDGAAQLAAPLLLAGLDKAHGARVLDACAAPGGKTAHLLELADLDVLALDIDAQRCTRIHDNLQRLGLQARVQAADAAAVGSWWDGQLFDAIMLDAPCSASGIVRRHPDIRWLRRPSDIEQLAAIQRSLLQQLWPLLKPQGVMLYCTCSVFKAEGQAQLQTFLDNNTDAVLGEAPGHLLPGAPGRDSQLGHNADRDHDGFFYALLRKAAR